ncbi:unnamed protein product [Pleuronectes platessa]|uniref:Uncharacterized protein n=1 Tax=Pleuronectes platessa TaxID=8262 RepID=A0A9N7ZB82_PLEPL|nr:unnamed protein product [Pleuronectes platessa]
MSGSCCCCSTSTSSRTFLSSVWACGSSHLSSCPPVLSSPVLSSPLPSSPLSSPLLSSSPLPIAPTQTGKRRRRSNGPPQSTDAWFRWQLIGRWSAAHGSTSPSGGRETPRSSTAVFH